MKLIIDIPDNVYEWVKNTGTFGIYRFNTAKAVKNGTPLDEVKAEIKEMSTDYCGGYIGLDKKEVLQILDNIGKESEEE